MYVVKLYKAGEFFAERSMTCGATTFAAACDQWERSGYTIEIVQKPKV